MDLTQQSDSENLCLKLLLQNTRATPAVVPRASSTMFGHRGSDRFGRLPLRVPGAPNIETINGEGSMSDTSSSNPKDSSRSSSATAASEGDEARLLALHVLDLGARKSGDIEDLKRGRGKLVNEIEDAIVSAESTLADAPGPEKIVPLIMIVQRKRKR